MAPNNKKIWQRGHLGAKKLLRAVKHHNNGGWHDHTRNKNLLEAVPAWANADFHNCCTDQSSLYSLYQHYDKRQMARVCFFMMQCMIFNVRAWPGPSQQVLDECGGWGFSTTARRAMLWHHEHLLRTTHLNRVQNATMFLVGRAIQDKDVVPNVLVLPEDVPSSSSHQVAVPCKPEKHKPTMVFELNNNMLEQLLDATKAGWLPWPAFFSEEQLIADYCGDIWKVLPQSKVQLVSLLILGEWTSE